MPEETPDSHDLDKLTRWHQGLVSDTGDAFPVCALFLAAGKDDRAHNIFRTYRTAFGELGAGFHDLVIFGQHGVSSTSAALMPGLGLEGLEVPCLALVTRGDPEVCHTAVLPGGVLAEGEREDDGEDVPWHRALDRIKDAVDLGKPLSLDGISGLDSREFPVGPLPESVRLVKDKVEENMGQGS
ncbi:MAG TPA: hypothetical protein DCE26_10715 [Dehalococcoidia bacterium]|nr:hypothetical protein [Dehalococcoidia bacterium]